MSDIRWEEPPRPASRPRIDYGSIAEELRNRPKEWAIVRVMPDAGRSSVVASGISRGKVAAFHPIGAFEAMARLVDGEYRVYARYVGGAP